MHLSLSYQALGITGCRLPQVGTDASDVESYDRIPELKNEEEVEKLSSRKIKLRANSYTRYQGVVNLIGIISSCRCCSRSFLDFYLIKVRSFSGPVGHSPLILTGSSSLRSNFFRANPSSFLALLCCDYYVYYTFFFPSGGDGLDVI